MNINGSVQVFNFGGQSTQNFWMSAGNFATTPGAGKMVWSVSQGTSLRRLHAKGDLQVSDGTYCSGGLLADSKKGAPPRMQPFACERLREDFPEFTRVSGDVWFART